MLAEGTLLSGYVISNTMHMIIEWLLIQQKFEFEFELKGGNTYLGVILFCSQKENMKSPHQVLKMHGHVLNIVGTDALLQKHQDISIYSTN